MENKLFSNSYFQDSFRVSPSRAASSESGVLSRHSFFRSNSSPPPPHRQSPLPQRRQSPLTSSSLRSSSSPPPPPAAHNLQRTDSDPQTLAGPVPVSSPTLVPKSRASLDQVSSPEDVPGPSILKNSLDHSVILPPTDDNNKIPTKSILKTDTNNHKSHDQSSSSIKYQVTEAECSSSSSTEDLAHNFSDVIIDPVPGQGRRSAPETPSKRVVTSGGSSGARSSSVSSGQQCPPLAPESLNISAADGDLASKLAKLAVEADCIKQKMSDNRVTASR